MKTLVIAEKPSVAADLARALGKVPKKGRIFSDDQAEYAVLEADARKIVKVRVVKLEAIPPPPKGSPKRPRKKKPAEPESVPAASETPKKGAAPPTA